MRFAAGLMAGLPMTRAGAAGPARTADLKSEHIAEASPKK